MTENLRDDPSANKLAAVSIAREWETSVPGAAERMFADALLDAKQLRRHATYAIILRFSLILVAAGTVAAFVFLATYFVDHGAPTQGAGVVGVGLVGLVGTLLGNQAVSARAAKGRAPEK